MARTGENFINLKVPAKPEYIGVIRLAIAGIADRLGLNCESVEDLKLSVTEACTSIIQFSKDPALILMECYIEKENLYLNISDGKLLPKDNELFQCGKNHYESLTEANMGIYLINALMDDLHYCIEPEKGIYIRMVKRLSTGEPIEQ